MGDDEYYPYQNMAWRNSGHSTALFEPQSTYIIHITDLTGLLPDT